MELFKAIILGFVQGFTEFLPVSSSGHIIIFEKLLNVKGGLFFSLILHFGTLLSVFVYMFKKVVAYLKNKQKILMVLIASVPAAIIGFTLSDILDKIFFDGKYLWCCFMFTALYMAAADWISHRKIKNLPLNYKRACVLGLAQAVAVIPAVSRSGTIFATGLLFGYEKSELSDFTFIMSIPVILGGCVFETIGCIVNRSIISFNVSEIILGIVAAFVSGLVALELAGNLFKKGNLRWFSLYLAALSLILVITRF